MQPKWKIVPRALTLCVLLYKVLVRVEVRLWYWHGWRGGYQTTAWPSYGLMPRPRQHSKMYYSSLLESNINLEAQYQKRRIVTQIYAPRRVIGPIMMSAHWSGRLLTWMSPFTTFAVHTQTKMMAMPQKKYWSQGGLDFVPKNITLHSDVHTGESLDCTSILYHTCQYLYISSTY